MNRIISRLVACFLSSVVCLNAAALLTASAETAALTKDTAVETSSGITISADKISTSNYKDTRYNNPVSSDFFCADPTSVEYNGRLYLFGTNDHEQFLSAGPNKDNTYEKIKSMLVFSTDDMVNWVYHGEINIGEIAPWITNSWAPSVVSRVEDDGLTHFYMYFSNNGLGVGVITSTDPVTGWTDPLGQPLISTSTPGIGDCPNPFDPGAVIDENGVGWLSFGAGKGSSGTDFMPGSARIVQLGDDMVSFASDFKEIPAAYLFEASELNYINGTYVYTYCSDWSDHTEQWPYDCPAPAGCGMVYMTTKTPLDPESWEMKGECFVNPGISGFDYSNNHTHMHKFKDKWYMFYHTLSLKRGMGITGSYRSMGVDEIEVDEQTVTITKDGGTKKGVKANGNLNPFDVNLASELNNTAEIEYDLTDQHAPTVSSKSEGSWFSVRSAEFTSSGESEEPTTPIELTQTNIDTLQYNITVLNVDAPTVVTMHPATNTGTDMNCSVEVNAPGKYTLTSDMGGAKGLMNMGYFTAENDVPITFVIDSIVVNDKYTIDITAELTNTREWADGLRNIWNGFSDGDTVYGDENAVFRYVGTDDAIELFVSESAGSAGGNAPLLETPVKFLASVKGIGRVEVRLDSPTGDILTSIDFDTPDAFTTIYNNEVAAIGGTHDLYFVFSDAGITMQSWCFAPQESTELVRGDVNADGSFTAADVVMMQKFLLNAGKLINWKAGDLNENERIDAFDLALMRQELLKK